MTVLADFQTIIGDGGQLINFAPPGSDLAVTGQQLGDPFEAGGRISGNSEVGPGAAFLMFSVTDANAVTEVFVNGAGPVGLIQRSGSGLWATQIIAMAGSRLNAGAGNVITVRTVLDPFFIKDLICFYHQDSD